MILVMNSVNVRKLPFLKLINHNWGLGKIAGVKWPILALLEGCIVHVLCVMEDLIDFGYQEYAQFWVPTYAVSTKVPISDI